jgi:streptomycin 6-kinase
LTSKEPSEALFQRARDWRVTLDGWFEGPRSIVAYGVRDDEPVVLKVVKQRDDEWRAGEMIAAFGGRGMVRVLEHTGGALLTDPLLPGDPLVEVVASGRDEEATAILADVIAAMSPSAPPPGCATVEEWGRGFAWYETRGDERIPASLVSRARKVYEEMCHSQTNVRLLHGDLHHSNVLFDRDRGWAAIDPKGVVGELEYEVGASLRNPREHPEVLSDPATIERRVATFAARLRLDSSRIRRWAFAQAVLSAIWTIQDGGHLDSNDPSLLLARVLARD